MDAFVTGNTVLPQTGTITSGSANFGYWPSTTWDCWSNWYYPTVIKESYPVYLQERAQDKGKQAFEIIKALQDKKLMKLDKVSDFIEAMDTLIKTL
jgi:hypothetical protein